MLHVEPRLPGFSDSQSVDREHPTLLIHSSPLDHTSPWQNAIYSIQWIEAWRRRSLEYLCLGSYPTCTSIYGLLNIDAVDALIWWIYKTSLTELRGSNHSKVLNYSLQYPMAALTFWPKGISNSHPTGRTAWPRSHYTPNHNTLNLAFVSLHFVRHLLQSRLHCILRPRPISDIPSPLRPTTNPWFKDSDHQPTTEQIQN